jgi:hypothetical protein
MLETAPEIDYATRACPDSWADYASEIRGAMDVLWEQ